MVFSGVNVVPRWLEFFGLINQLHSISSNAEIAVDIFCYVSYIILFVFDHILKLAWTI